MRILLAEADEDFRALLVLHLAKGLPAAKLESVRDGRSLVDRAWTANPEIVIANAFLPGLDGLSALGEIRRKPFARQPELVIMSAACGQAMQEVICALHPAFFTALPCDLRQLTAQVTLCCRQSVRQANFRTRKSEPPLSRLLRELGISAQSKGFRYLEACLGRMNGSEELRGSLTKVVYPDVARRFGTNPCNVERSIRSAIVAAWDQPGFLLQNQLFFRRPTNGEFLTVVYRLLQDQVKEGS